MDPEDPDNPDHSQNLITSSFYHFRHILKILSKSVHKFLSYLVHKQTDGQTNPGKNITSLAEVKNRYIVYKTRPNIYKEIHNKVHHPARKLEEGHI